MALGGARRGHTNCSSARNSESWQCWKHQIPRLSEQFRVIAIDLKGYGKSGKEDGDYSMTAVASEIIKLLNHIEVSNFHLAGHDWGVAIWIR